MTKLKTYAALLRGINNVGPRIIRLDDLRKVFESMGFKAVKTLLASGNVLFDAPPVRASAGARARRGLGA